MTLLTAAFLTALVAGIISVGIPLLLAGLGEQLSEKAGVLNIGIEGMMLGGCYLGFLVAWKMDSTLAGFAASLVGGMLVAAAVIIFCVWLGLNQIVVGIALTLGMEGGTAILHHIQLSRTYPRLPSAETWAIPLLSKLPVFGSALFNTQPVAYGSVIFVGVMAYLYRYSALGLMLQAAGDKPAALDVAGISVFRIRAFAVLMTGAFAGAAGGFMSIVAGGIFIPFMTHGNGFIGIVLAMLARGRPSWVLAGSVLFGTCLSLATALQVAGIDVPTDVIQMLPFAAVMLVLVIWGRRAQLPAALGHTYTRGAR